MSKLIYEASSCPGKLHNGKAVTYHNVTIDNNVMDKMSADEIKDALYTWFKNNITNNNKIKD